MNILWGFVLKHWVKLLPVLVAVGLALCVRHTIQANARADVYARVVQMQSKYLTQQEIERVNMKAQYEDTVKAIRAVNTQETVHRQKDLARASQLTATLREQLQGVQRTALDSAQILYENSVSSLALENLRLERIITLRTAERDKAEQLLADSQRYNATLQQALQAEAKANRSTIWKVATAVAVVGGIAAYVAHP